MKYRRRDLEPTLLAAMRGFPAVVLTGPRRAGKTFLLQNCFPDTPYFLLEDPEVVGRIRADPQGFLQSLKTPMILDEVQNVPEIFAHVRAHIDRQPRKLGRWLLTGSQEAPLMQRLTESMAGRAAVLQLLPFSVCEHEKVDLLRGGYPEVVQRPRSSRLWFSSYLQTYLERDIRQIINVKDLALFRRFLALLASRHGQVLNRTDLAAPLGVSVPTISSWLGALETTLQIVLVPPFYENLGKRLIKSPKLYFLDPGLVCHLLGIESEAELRRSPFLGAVFEGLIASEIAKSQLHRGLRRELYYFRDQQGLEVDFLVPGRGGTIHLIEAKASKSVNPRMAEPMRKLSEAFKRTTPRRRVEMTLVHEASRQGAVMETVAPSVRALTWRAWATAGAASAAGAAGKPHATGRMKPLKRSGR
jgi:predicted AAA+ superfamily ATPase